MRREPDWSVGGSGGEPILGYADAPAHGEAGACVLFAHGWKGYAHYGFMPPLARALADGLGVVVHRFNFSHSGVREDDSAFGRPDLFERDTWNRQVEDLDTLIDGAASGSLPGTPRGCPIVLMGHSRGGASSLICAGRRFRDRRGPAPACVIAISAPSEGRGFSAEEERQLRERGWYETASSRTGQTLRVGLPRLQEQLDDPEGHDILGLCGLIACPVLAIHGGADPTVPAECSRRIAGACPDGRAEIVPGADHVWNTRNPFDGEASPALGALIEAVSEFTSSAIA